MLVMAPKSMFLSGFSPNISAIEVHFHFWSQNDPGGAAGGGGGIARKEIKEAYIRNYLFPLKFNLQTKEERQKDARTSTS